MNIFPFMEDGTPEIAAASKELPLFREYAYDFAENRLLEKDGRTYLISGNEALKVWIYKALHTNRYYHMAYSRAYGNEIRTLMGQPIQQDILLPELKRFIVETLMVNPYIKALLNFAFSVEGAKVSVTFDCKTVYGDMQMEHFFEGS